MSGTLFDETDTVWAPPDMAVDDNGAVHSEIQSAVDNADSMVLVGPGTFNENVTISEGTIDNGMLMGVGDSTLIDGGSTGPAVTLEANDVTVKSLAVSTSGGGGTVDAFVVDDATVVSDPRIEEITVVAADRHGINLQNASGGWVDRCNVEVTGLNGIQNAADRCAVSNCYIGETKGDIGNFGIQPEGSVQRVTNNHVYGTSSIGISSSGNDTLIAGNVLQDATTAGVRITGDSQKVMGNEYVGVTEDVQSSTATNALVDEGGSSGPTRVEELVDSPNGHIANAILDNGESAEITVPVPDTETLKVYRWGAYKVSDGTTPLDLDVELLDGTDTVQATENTGNTESTGTPVASHQNTSGSTSIFKLAAANDTGATIADPGVGAMFAYIVE